MLSPIHSLRSSSSFSYHPLANPSLSLRPCLLFLYPCPRALRCVLLKPLFVPISSSRSNSSLVAISFSSFGVVFFSGSVVVSSCISSSDFLMMCLACNSALSLLAASAFVSCCTALLLCANLQPFPLRQLPLAPFQYRHVVLLVWLFWMRRIQGWILIL